MELVKKIDIHVHTQRVPGIPSPVSGSRPATPKQLRQMYDQLGIEKGVIQIVSLDYHYGLVTNEDIHDVVMENPESFYWFCNVDPRQSTNNADADFEFYLSYYKSLGAKGVGEITANLYFDDPRMLALFRDCEKCGMPVIFHIGNDQNDYGVIDEMGLPRLEKVLQMFPNLKFLGHSQKFWAEISGDLTAEERDGYPTGKVVPGGRVVELMRKYPNLYCDLSAGSGFNAISRDPEFGYAFFEEFQDRLFFGTDICAPENMFDCRVKLSKHLDDAVLAGKISYDAYYKISRGNALKLLEG